MRVRVDYNHTTRVKARTNQNIFDDFEDASQRGANLAQSFAPIDSGALKASADSTATLRTTGVHAEFFTETNPEYNIFQEYGTGIYAGDADPGFPGQRESQGSRAKKIPWVYFKNGRFYTTWGNKPQPFMRPAYEIVKPELEADLRHVVR